MTDMIASRLLVLEVTSVGVVEGSARSGPSLLTRSRVLFATSGRLRTFCLTEFILHACSLWDRHPRLQISDLLGLDPTPEKYLPADKLPCLFLGLRPR